MFRAVRLTIQERVGNNPVQIYMCVKYRVILLYKIFILFIFPSKENYSFYAFVIPNHFLEYSCGYKDS